MEHTSEKMYAIATHLDELNRVGKVKGFKGNENGYAKVIQICRGCSIWVHHEKNGELIIDLLASPTAVEKNPILCGNAINKFQAYFDFSADSSKWNHCIDSVGDYERYYVVVTKYNTQEIIEKLEQLMIYVS